MIKNHIRLLSGIITLHVISSESPRIRKPQNIIDPERRVLVRAHEHTLALALANHRRAHTNAMKKRGM